METNTTDPYFIDFPQRIKDIQNEMQKQNIELYLGSRLRTLSWTVGVFCPWRSFIVIPGEGTPTVFTFGIDAGRVGHDSWLHEEQVLGYAPMEGLDQIGQIAVFIKGLLKNGKGRIGIESGMSNYLPEGNLAHYEYEQFESSLAGSELVNAHTIIDSLSLIKDAGTINRFREASRIVDVGHQAIYDAIQNGGYKGMTETEIAGLAVHAMRQAGSEKPSSYTRRMEK